MRVHITGFTAEEKEELKKIIKELNLEYEEDFTRRTSVLICESVLLQKYKVGKIMDICVTNRKWLLDSKNNAEISDPKNYEISIFENLKICLFDFDEKNLEMYKSVLLRNKGKWVEIEEVLSKSESCDFIVFENGKGVIKEEIINLKEKTRLVSKEWFLACLNYNQYIYHDKYLLYDCKKVAQNKVNFRPSK
jgi:hypothetical protein